MARPTWILPWRALGGPGRRGDHGFGTHKIIGVDHLPLAATSAPPLPVNAGKAEQDTPAGQLRWPATSSTF